MKRLMIAVLLALLSVAMALPITAQTVPDDTEYCDTDGSEGPEPEQPCICEPWEECLSDCTCVYFSGLSAKTLATLKLAATYLDYAERQAAVELLRAKHEIEVLTGERTRTKDPVVGVATLDYDALPDALATTIVIIDDAGISTCGVFDNEADCRAACEEACRSAGHCGNPCPVKNVKASPASCSADCPGNKNAKCVIIPMSTWMTMRMMWSYPPALA